MTIETSHAQAVVRTSDGTAVVSMDSALSGFAARVQMPTMYQRCYVCVRPGENFAHLFVVTGEKWRQDIIDTGFTVVGELGEMIQQARAVTKCTHISTSEDNGGQDE